MKRIVLGAVAAGIVAILVVAAIFWLHGSSDQGDPVVILDRAIAGRVEGVDDGHPVWSSIADTVRALAARGKLNSSVAEHFLESQDRAERRVGAMVLDALSRSDAVSAVERLLQSPRTGASVSDLVGLLATNPDQSTIPFLARHAHHPDIEVRSVAIYGLATIGDAPEVIAALRESLSRGQELRCWPIRKENPGYLRSTADVRLTGRSAATYLVALTKNVGPFLASILQTSREPVVAADILAALWQSGDSHGVSWCRENVPSLRVGRSGTPGSEDQSWLLYWGIRTLANTGQRSDRQLAFGATERLVVAHQRMLGGGLVNGNDREALYDFILVAAESDTLVESLKDVLVGEALFAGLLKERFQMEEPSVSGLAAFRVWYRSLPKAP